MRAERGKNEFASNMVVSLKDDRWLQYQRIAGRIASDTLIALEQEVKNRTQLSMIDLNAYAEEIIAKAGGTPTFKGYGRPPFPASCCVSINKTLVHGIPTDYKLQEGDLVSFDLGVTIEGTIADTAVTCLFGNAKSDKHVQLIKSTETALMKGIEAIQVGNRLGCIGQAIYKVARASGFSVITKYGGHGISWNEPHAAPFVANKATENEGIRIQPGIVIAIEPLFVLGSSDKTTTLDDGWTVVCDDICDHAEHTIFVHEDHVEIITDRTR